MNLKQISDNLKKVKDDTAPKETYFTKEQMSELKSLKSKPTGQTHTYDVQRYGFAVARDFRLPSQVFYHFSSMSLGFDYRTGETNLDKKYHNSDYVFLDKSEFGDLKGIPSKIASNRDYYIYSYDEVISVIKGWVEEKEKPPVEREYKEVFKGNITKGSTSISYSDEDVIVFSADDGESRMDTSLEVKIRKIGEGEYLVEEVNAYGMAGDYLDKVCTDAFQEGKTLSKEEMDAVYKSFKATKFY